MFRKGPFSRNRDGSYKLRLSPEERDLLRTLPGQLREVLGTDDPSLFRLFPTAYIEDLKKDVEYRRLIREELITRRLEALEVVESTIDAERLNEGQLTAWMKVINDLRLVIGTRLDVEEDDDPNQPLSPEDPQAPLRALYWFLSYLLEATVEALSGAL